MTIRINRASFRDKAHVSFVLHTDAASLPASARLVPEITAEGRAEAGYLTVVMKG